MGTEEIPTYQGEFPVTKEWRDAHLGEEWAFEYRMDLDDLIEVEGIEGMNDYLDAVLSAIVLSDITYRILRLEDDGTLMIEARGIIEEF